MVLLAFGILLVSVAFIVYYNLANSWSLRGQQEPRSTDAKSRDGLEDLTQQRQSGAARAAKDLKATKPTADQADIKMDGQEEDAVTPKAAPVPNATSLEIPAFSLSGSANESSAKVEKSEAPVIRATSPAAGKTASSLMPPPSVRPSALRPLPRGNGSLMPPPSAAAALRTPPGRTPQKAGQNGNGLVPASTSTLPPGSRPRKKIILPPGHSPLDWAHLTRNPPTSSFLRGEDIPSRMLKVSPTQLKYYHGRKGRDAWGTYQGKVYNMTPYKDFHPGGVGELMRGAGKPGEAERLFNEIHPWVNWDGMLIECLVGVLVGEGEGDGERGSGAQVDLDEMD